MFKKIKQKLTKPLWYIYYKILKLLYAKERIFLYWFNLNQNFGDSINPLFISMLSNKKVVRVNPRFSSIDHVLAIGSIIEHGSAQSIIWGSGFISENSELKEKPKKVLAVRGPKSRKRMQEYGIECPEVYGDPALLLPKVYSPSIEKKYQLGIVPHHSDKNNKLLLELVSNNNNIKVIDLQKLDVWEVIDDILSCDRIASSSLHGIITADAYSIPSAWIQFSDKVIGKGFKFLDYFESVGRKDIVPLIIDESTQLEDIKSLFYDYKIKIDLQKLIDAAPFDINIIEKRKQ